MTTRSPSLLTIVAIALVVASATAKLYPEGYCNNYGICAREGGTSFNCFNITKAVKVSSSFVSSNDCSSFFPFLAWLSAYRRSAFPPFLLSSFSPCLPFLTFCSSCLPKSRLLFILYWSTQTTHLPAFCTACPRSGRILPWCLWWSVLQWGTIRRAEK